MPYLTKPHDEFVTLDKHLAPRGVSFNLMPGQRLLSDEQSLSDTTIVLQKGAVSLHRQNHAILFGVVQGPSIFGLAAAASPIHHYYSLTAEVECRGYSLPAKETLQCLDRYQLWREAFYWMAWQTRLLELRDKQLIGANHYHQIRETLLMMLGWDDNLRSRIGVLNYIQQRTRISRSVIAEVLAELRKGDYIQMEKGKLVGITRLPLEY
ncbi:helix-turn-helix domain-containing protein [Kluyvera sp. M-M157-B]|uniref:helix-turn-helix domain-containing protein n=1 Tax=Kluyvera sp. M-M157-B TaxID=3402291 RepID=UPI003B26D244